MTTKNKKVIVSDSSSKSECESKKITKGRGRPSKVKVVVFDSSSESDCESKKITKNKGGRPSKTKEYEENRIEVINKLNDILGVSDIDNGDFFYLDKIDEDKQDQVLALADEIKLYFLYAKWPYFKNRDVVRPFLSLIKSVYKSMGFDVRLSNNYVTQKGVTKKITKVLIDKKK